MGKAISYGFAETTQCCCGRRSGLAQRDLLLGCGIAITDSPITVLQKILKRINLRLPYLRNERDGEKRLRIYGGAKSRFESLEHQEEKMFGHWLKQCQDKFDVPEAA